MNVIQIYDIHHVVDSVDSLKNDSVYGIINSR